MLFWLGNGPTLAHFLYIYMVCTSVNYLWVIISYTQVVCFPMSGCSFLLVFMVDSTMYGNGFPNFSIISIKSMLNSSSLLLPQVGEAKISGNSSESSLTFYGR